MTHITPKSALLVRPALENPTALAQRAVPHLLLRQNQSGSPPYSARSILMTRTTFLSANSHSHVLGILLSLVWELLNQY